MPRAVSVPQGHGWQIHRWQSAGQDREYQVVWEAAGYSGYEFGGRLLSGDDGPQEHGCLISKNNQSVGDQGVFLFNGAKLRGQLKARGIARIGTATSVAQELWKEAEILSRTAK